MYDPSVKAISIQQPFATLIATGRKEYETRGRRTNYRGPIAIYASKTMWENGDELMRKWNITEAPTGVTSRPGRLVECVPTEELVKRISTEEKECGFHGPGRFGWRIVDVVPLPQPIPAAGSNVVPWETDLI